MSCRLKHAVLFANRLILLGVSPGAVRPALVEIGEDTGRISVPTLVNFALPAAISRFAQASEQVAFMTVSLLPPNLVRAAIAAVHGQTIRLVAPDRTTIVTAELDFGPIKPLLPNLAIEFRLLALELSTIDPQLSVLLEGVCADEPVAMMAHLDIEATAPTAGLLVHGWAANVSVNPVAFLLDGCRLLASPDQVFFHVRPDVFEHIGNAQVSNETPLHGFTLVDNVRGTGHSLTVVTFHGSVTRWSTEMEIATMRGPWEILQLLGHLVPSGEHAGRSRLATLRAMLGDFGPKGSAGTIETLGPSTNPRVSIIVPYTVDSFFLRDLLEAQHSAPDEVEWLHVCANPLLLEPMATTIKRGAEGLSQPTSLIATSHHASFAAAANLAFPAARGEFVVLMSPEIYWLDFAPLSHAIELLQADLGLAAVGFTLHYEDGTLQHGGARVRPSTDGAPLLPISVGRGTPSPLHGRAALSEREVDLVSSALLVLRRSDWDDAVFDERFLAIEFAGYDLCLRLQRGGKKIVVIECDTILHLAPQSALTGSATSLFTMVDGAALGAKWFLKMDAVG